MTIEDIMQKLLFILEAYPDYNTEYLKVLFSFDETKKIAGCLKNRNVDELSADDFENIAEDGDFLFYCGLYTLNYGIKALKRDFLILSKDLTNRSKRYHNEDTHDWGIIAFNEGKATKELANFESKKDNLEKAIELFKVAYDKEEKNSEQAGQILTEIVVCKKNLADLGINPDKNLSEALKIISEIKRNTFIRSSEYYSFALGNEANIRRLLAENGFDEIENLRESIHLSKKTCEQPIKRYDVHSKSLLNEGIATRMLAQYSFPEYMEKELNDSIKLYRRARKEGLESNKIEYASALTEEGVSNHGLAKLSTNPIKYLNNTIKLHRKAILNCEYGHVYYKILNNEASALLDLYGFDNEEKNLNNAKKIYNKVTEVFEKNNDRLSLIILNNNFGKSYYSLKKYADAYEYLIKSIELIENIRSSININNRNNFFKMVIQTYKLLVLTCIALNNNEEAFMWAESSKARTFHEFLWSRNKEKNNQSEENISPIRLDTLSKLVEDKTFIEYFLLEGWGNDKLAIFIIKDNELIVKVTQNVIVPKVIQFRDIVDEIIDIGNKYRYGIINLKEHDDLREKNCNKLEELLKSLNDLLIKPIKNYLSEEIIIIPHTFLHLLPFHALKGDRYLIQDHKISLAQSASSLEYLNHEGNGSLVVGNPNKMDPQRNLPHSEEEVIAVAKKLKTNPLIGDYATRNAVLSQISDKNILHFSCHGFFDPINPIYSGIVLSDATITANDFMNLEMNANLMVLSACDTGLGVVSNTDEIEGLVRSIQIGGCRFVIASLWPVEDESTKYLFLNFYNGNGNVLDRMQNAQIDLIDKYDIFTWAPFQTYGI